MKIATLILGTLALTLTACGGSPEAEAARAEERLEELEQEFNELVARDDATFEELGEILDEAAELDETPGLVAKREEEERRAREAAEEQAEAVRRRLLENAEEWGDALLLNPRAPETGASDEVPPRDIETVRAEATAAVAEAEGLHDELIALHKAFQEAHTDEWEKRWAGDRVTLAEMDKERFLEEVGPRLRSEELREVDRAVHSAMSWKLSLEEDVADAREQLKALKTGGDDAP